MFTHTGEKTPLVLLNGRPGYPSYSLNPLLALSEEWPVIIFDQLGCGRSDKITDTSLMTIDTFVEQLDQLLTELEITEFSLFGHSWGNEDYVVTGTPKGYDRTNKLGQIKVPTLYLTGEYDAARPSTVKQNKPVPGKPR